MRLITIIALLIVFCSCATTNAGMANSGEDNAALTVTEIAKTFENSDWNRFGDYISVDFDSNPAIFINSARDAALSHDEIRFDVVRDAVSPIITRRDEKRFDVKFHWFRSWRDRRTNEFTQARGDSHWHIVDEKGKYRLASALGDSLW